MGREGGEVTSIPPHVAGSDTSKEAAQEIASVVVTVRSRVYEYICAAGERGVTDEEIQHALRLDPSTERPRRVELVKAGLVSASPYFGRTRAKRRATLWRDVRRA